MTGNMLDLSGNSRVPVIKLRRSPDSEAVWFTPPQTAAEWKQQMEALRLIFDRDRPNATE